ncbi:MAG: peptidoglycan recognition family protein [Cyanobacteria bacterium P01_F01_bin.53]
MVRAWLASIISSATFLLTAFLVVSSGPAQEPAAPNKRVRPGQRLHLNRAEKALPDISFPDLSAGLTGSRSGQLSAQNTAQSTTGYQPKEEIYLADPSNYGERFKVDHAGNPLNNDYLVVLHETVGSASSAINLFQANHPNDNDQVSYHTLIALDGTVIYVVSPEQRAFGAGNSAFKTPSGEESVTTNPEFPSSVNNFAYHISLETPPDGQNSGATTHSGYTEAQYQSLAWLLARTTVPNERITTHKAVDRSGSRIDPRSFEPERLFSYLTQYPNRASLD